MADIELVIKIPEEVKNRLCFGVTYPKDIQVVCEALNDGTQLPKGHGRLKDVSKIYNHIDALNHGKDKGKFTGVLAVINMAETIIEADTAESEVTDENTV